MKKNLLFLNLFVFFSSLTYCFSNPFASTSVKTDIYSTMRNIYKKEGNESFSDGISVLAQKYGIDESYISNILKGKLIYCSIGNNNLLKQLNINTGSNYNSSNYTDCYKQINQQLNNYVDTKIKNKELSNSLLSENLLANGKDDDSPYDLVIDVQDLSDVLFKQKMKKIPFGKVNIGKTGKSAAKSLGIGNAGNDISTTPVASTNPSALTNSVASTSPSASVSSEVSTSSSISTNPVATVNPKVSVNPVATDGYANPNVQIGNQCGSGSSNSIISNLESIDNSNTANVGIDSDIENLKNIDNSNGNNGIVSNTNQDKLFDIFGSLSGDKGKFIDGLFTPFSGFKGGFSVKGGFAGGGGCAGQNKLLSVCFKLIPSGPRGPVGGISFVHSIEQEIDKIGDTLKDIKQSFIIPAGHGDEALDIDFKHIKFANIMAFNIVLTSKPVFNFKKDEKTEKEANAVDTECDGVPHKLAVMYSRLGIAYCLDKGLDKDKYLFTNVSTVKIPLNPSLKPIKNDTSTNGVYNEEKQYRQLLSNILGFTTSLNKLMGTWLNSSIALEAKSE